MISRRNIMYLRSITSLRLYHLQQVEPTKEELKQRKKGEQGSSGSMRNKSRKKKGGLHLDSLRQQFYKRLLSKKVEL